MLAAPAKLDHQFFMFETKTIFKKTVYQLPFNSIISY